MIILANVKIVHFSVIKIEAGRGSHCSGNSISSHSYMFQLLPGCHLQNGFSTHIEMLEVEFCFMGEGDVLTKVVL